MDNLKKWNFKTYKTEYKYSKCYYEKETLSYLQEYLKATNNMVILQLKAKKKLFRLIKQSGRFKN